MKKWLFISLFTLIFISCHKAYNDSPKVNIIYDGENVSTSSEGPYDSTLTYIHTIHYRAVNNGICEVKQINLRFTCYFSDGYYKSFNRTVYNLQGLSEEKILFDVTYGKEIQFPIQVETNILPQCGCD